MNEIILKEKFDVEMMKKLIYSNKIDKKDQIDLINKLKKYSDGIFEVKYKNDIFGRLKTSTYTYVCMYEYVCIYFHV
jgi:hypothetical protein